MWNPSIFSPDFTLRVGAVSRTGLTLDTPAATHYPAQLPAAATATVINGTKWEWVAAPAATRLSQSPMASEEEATSRGRQLTVALTQALMEPLTTPTFILITAAPHHCWLQVGAERAGSGQSLHGTAPLREVAGYWRGPRLLLSPQVLQEKGVLTGQAEPPLLTFLLETVAHTV